MRKLNPLFMLSPSQQLAIRGSKALFGDLLAIKPPALFVNQEKTSCPACGQEKHFEVKVRQRMDQAMTLSEKLFSVGGFVRKGLDCTIECDCGYQFNFFHKVTIDWDASQAAKEESSRACAAAWRQRPAGATIDKEGPYCLHCGGDDLQVYYSEVKSNKDLFPTSWPIKYDSIMLYPAIFCRNCRTNVCFVWGLQAYIQERRPGSLQGVLGKTEGKSRMSLFVLEAWLSFVGRASRVEMAAVALLLASAPWFGNSEALRKVVEELRPGCSHDFAVVARAAELDPSRFVNQLKQRLAH